MEQHKHTGPDLRCGYSDQCDHGQQGETRIQVNQKATGSRAVFALWADQQHHQAVDQSQEGRKKALNHKDGRQHAD